MYLYAADMVNRDILFPDESDQNTLLELRPNLSIRVSKNPLTGSVICFR